MALVRGWLEGLGLAYAVPAFRDSGLLSPEGIATLTLENMDMLRIEDTSDRQKLWFLVQRVRLAIEKKKTKTERDEAVGRRRTHNAKENRREQLATPAGPDRAALAALDNVQDDGPCPALTELVGLHRRYISKMGETMREEMRLVHGEGRDWGLVLGNLEEQIRSTAELHRRWKGFCK